MFKLNEGSISPNEAKAKFLSALEWVGNWEDKNKREDAENFLEGLIEEVFIAEDLERP